jgi:cytidylate kinase
MFAAVQDLREPFNIAVDKRKTSVFATKRRSINLTSNLIDNGTIEDVLHCREVLYNLQSEKPLQENGMAIIFDSSGVTINKGKETILTRKPFNGLIAVVFKVRKIMVNSGNQSVVTNNNNIQDGRIDKCSLTEKSKAQKERRGRLRFDD